MRPLAFLFAAALALSACDVFCEDCELTVTSLFGEGITAEATPSYAAYDQPLTIRTTVVPRFDGSGTFQLRYIAGGQTAEVLGPTAGSIGPSGVHTQRVEFEAGVPEVVEWTVQLGPRDGYVDGHGFPISVGADSVEVQGALRPAESDEVGEAFRGEYDEVVTWADHYPLLVLRER